MALPESLQTCLDGLLAKYQVYSWNIFNMQNGLINVSLKLSTDKDVKTTTDNVTYKRISDKQKQRNLARAESHQKNTLERKKTSSDNTHFTRSKAVTMSEDKECEIPRSHNNNIANHTSDNSTNQQSLSPHSTDSPLINEQPLLDNDPNGSLLSVNISDGEHDKEELIMEEAAPDTPQPIETKTPEPVSNKNYKMDIGNSHLRNYDPVLIPPDAKVNKYFLGNRCCLYVDSRMWIKSHSLLKADKFCEICDVIICSECTEHHAALHPKSRDHQLYKTNIPKHECKFVTIKRK